MSSTPGPLGFITETERTQEQHDAHAAAESRMLSQFGFPVMDVPKGTKVILTKLWDHPDVIADVGRRFIRELQNTGSCVKVGATNALRCTIATQRVTAESPTKAFEPFTWHNYGLSRHYFGQNGQGEGSLGSTFAKSLNQDGVIEWPKDTTDNLPDYVQSGDHINISGSQEMSWSSYRNPQVQVILTKSREHLLGNAGLCRTPTDIKGMILNGYGVSIACDNFVGSGAVRGEGENAYVRGRWGQSGGHQQWIFGYWEHPEDGPLYATGNNWADNTYPRDPAGLPLCCVWVSEADTQAAMRLHGEVYGFSHLDWFPANPGVLQWFEAFAP